MQCYYLAQWLQQVLLRPHRNAEQALETKKPDSRPKMCSGDSSLQTKDDTSLGVVKLEWMVTPGNHS